MKATYLWILSFCLWTLTTIGNPAGSVALDSEEEPRLPLAMEVFLKKPKEHQYTIHIHLTNISQKPVQVDIHDLPWTPPNSSRWLVASRMDDTQSPIAQRSRKWEFGSQEVRLLPGESIQDKLALNPRMPTILSDIKQFGIQLHWDCPPPSLNFVCKPSSPNIITIPKDDPGQPDVHPIDQQACRKLQKSINLIRIPQDHEVLFLLASHSMMADIPKIHARLYQVNDYVQQCQPMWTNSWAVSFFTDKKLAGFLSDVGNERYYEQGLWQRANIGQYSSQIRTLYRFPWIKTKADSVYLSVYRQAARPIPKTRDPR